MRTFVRAGGAMSALCLFSAAARAGEELYISLPDISEIRKFDVDTGTLTPWATNVGVTLYGEWGADDRLYIADLNNALIWAIDAGGIKTVISSGGLLKYPLSVCIHPTTGELYVTDFGFQHVVAIDPATGAQRVFCDNSLGLFMVPGGIAFDPQGNLWMTDHGTHDIFRMDPAGNLVEFIDGPSVGLDVPAGIEVDCAGNVFVAGYENCNLVRIRADSGEMTVFCDDPVLMDPNDVAFANDGSVYTTTAESSALVKIDAGGNATVLYQDAALGAFLGVAVRRTVPLDGSMSEYGTGTAGSGGHVPQLHGIFTPDLGVTCALEVTHANGGAGGFLLGGLAAGALPIWGGTCLVDLGVHFDIYPVTHSGSGAGNGTWLIDIEIPNDDPILAGLATYWQDLVFDKGAPKKIAMSNGLELILGT
ncbi:MAG: hypothetical protein EXS13_10955 [Planctomycetes bacterium]|nr:hypothetical protein [Planctomycetota bacterium]